jgi:amino acid adenylation domain-containing protein
LEQAANRRPDKIAFEDERGGITFKELRDHAKRLGTRLLKRHTGGIQPVLVLLPRSTDVIVSFMGALYSANPYAPVEADIPEARLAKLIENLQPGQIITDAEHLAKVTPYAGDAAVHLFGEAVSGEIDEGAVAGAVNSVIDTDPVYIIYTSGSTGIPKGVTIPHRGVLDFAEWVKETFRFDEDTVLANQAAFYFDNSIFDIYGGLLSCATVKIVPQRLVMVPSKLPDYLFENEVTAIFWVPTVMIGVANSGALSSRKLPKLKTVAFAGEVMPNLQLNIWRREHPDCVYANLYGTTEISDVCTYYIADRPFEDNDPLPIGIACENTRMLILNEQNKLCGPGEQGELCVGGSGVALGYWNAPELTEKVFIQNPINTRYGERIYRTGDLALYSEDGLILFLGRRDSQVKVRGNRIELGEIEAAALCVEGVGNACALFDPEKQEIVLFVGSAADYNPRKFNLALKPYIPNYMLPGRLVTLRELPLTANGKIDRVTLRDTFINGG